MEAQARAKNARDYSFTVLSDAWLEDRNASSLDAYVDSLLKSRGLIEDAIHAGLDGDAARAAIAAIRTTWSKVQFGPDDHRVPDLL